MAASCRKFGAIATTYLLFDRIFLIRGAVILRLVVGGRLEGADDYRVVDTNFTCDR